MARATRDQIVGEADRLFYEQGFEHTSFADIAAAVGISRGNFYHHFKTKDEILIAVIDRRLEATRALLAAWENEAGDSPAARIRCFIRILIANRAKILRHGCPVGTLTAELAKIDHPSLSDAGRLFALFRDWLARQFAALGLGPEADRLALHLIARSQGIATLANALGDAAFVEREVADLTRWLDCTVPASA